MLVEDYTKLSNEANEDVMGCFSSWEKKLCSILSRVEIGGRGEEKSQYCCLQA